MAQVYPYVVEFNDYYNTNFDLISAISFDGDFDEVDTGEVLDQVYTERPNGTRIVYGAKYNDVLELTITLIKANYEYFTKDEIRTVLRWLGGIKKPSWLKLYDDEYEEIAEYYGTFTQIQQETADSKTIGFIATFTSAYPHGFSPLRHVEQIYTGQEVIVLEQDGDETEEYVRPYIVITPENEDIAEMTITNQDTEDVIKIKNIKMGEELTIDCENKIVYSNIV